jgi:hypothetical protein
LEQKRKNEIEEKEEFNRKRLRKLGSEVKESHVAESEKGDQARGKVQVAEDTRCISRGWRRERTGPRCHWLKRLVQIFSTTCLGEPKKRS